MVASQPAAGFGRAGAASDARPRRRQESYTWPLLALVCVVVPQVLIPPHDRVGPPLAVPMVEGVVLLVLLLIAAKPGPVPRGARPLVLSLSGLLLVANAVAAARLVAVVLDNRKVDGVAPSATRLLVAASLILLANIVTF